MGALSYPVHVWVVRHGQIAANRDGVWHGSTDSALTWRGRRQAKRANKYLQKLDVQFDALVSSPLQRCQRTAELVSKRMDLELQIHDGLAEMSLGEWEGIPFKVLHEEYDLFNTLRSDPNFAPPGGESLNAVSSRVVAALNDLQAQGKHVLCVTHGVTFGIALSELLHQTPTQWQEYVVYNCSVTELRFLPEPVVHSFNTIPHL